jgi:hypothetical protein
LADVESEDESQRQLQEKILKAESAFREEPLDWYWASGAANLIRHNLNAPELEGSSLVNAECRATQCRIEVEHLSHEQQEEFEFRFPSLFVEMLPRTTLMTSEEQSDGSVRAVIYAVRADNN